MKDYDLKDPSKLITYLVMNNLYSWAMISYLPYGRFKWLKNVDGFDVNSIREIVHQPLKNLHLLMICCQMIAKKLLTDMK